ncbi:uncharacterized protein LOC122876682 isoform X3 [Siniperca chuatsi]|uniref:uncharacterized protein LOC122876682 isoform X3 n=1 Tax=Siniperca chuatsi TaxID=119488 RepID=UPI001CE161D2|nr:uncharacterized protein LOC122876682 isoform X3 [Siniperca chuatsi]
MPEHTINVAGKDIVFLVDSGATDSVIRDSEFAVLPKMSGRFVRTVGVSGTPLVERYTTPLPCSEEIEKHFKHSFLLSKRCPINIIGRDMMIRLGIILISTPEGIIVARISDTASQYVKHSSRELMYSYQWKLPHTAAGSVNNTLIAEVRALFPDNYTRIDIKLPQELHCTSHVHLGVDKHFEDTWFRQDKERNTLKLTWLYWNDKRCTVSVAFNDPLCEALFQVPNTYPHVPLVKAKQDTWECLGPWTRRCEEAAGWVKTSDSGVDFHNQLQSRSDYSMRKFSSPNTYFPGTETPGRRRTTTLEIRAGPAGASQWILTASIGLRSLLKRQTANLTIVWQ